MNRISLSKCTKLIILIWLTTCKNEINSIELSCNITTSQTNFNKTQIDVKPIIAVNKCAKDYRDVDIVKKCEYFINSNKSETNFSLYKPVTNRFKNITYWNEFCATCNYETELEYWPRWTQLDYLDFVCTMYDLEVMIGSSADDLHRIIRNFIRHGLKLISKSGNSTELQCSVDENWPLNLLHFLNPCLTDQFRKSQNKKFYSCEYVKKNGRACLGLNVIIEGIDFVLDKSNKTVLLDQTMNKKFIQSGYTIESGLDKVMYLCAGSEKVRGIFFWIDSFVNILSITLIVVYLFLNFTEQYLQSFPNKIIYSYAIGLLITYLLTTFVFLLFPLLEAIYFLSYSFLFFWTIIMSLEFSRLTYSTFRKRKVTVSSQPGRYLIYCFVGYVIPTVLFVIYFLILETNEKQCSQLPDHFGIPARPLEKSVAWYFIKISGHIFTASLSIFLPILFILLAGVLIYISKCGPTRIRSTANRNHTIVLMKMACIMGFQWMVNILIGVYNGNDEPSNVIIHVGLISVLFIDFQGVFVFFAFGFKKRWLKDILFKFGCKEKSTQQSISSGTGTTVLFTSSSVQLSDSVGTKE